MTINREREGRRCPFSAPPQALESGSLNYESYLKIQDLLGLQVPLSKPPHHDEMLFIVIHQAYELWFKLILHELEATLAEMAAGKVLQAHHFLSRVNEVLKLLVQQIHILETMTPVDFLEFRDRLTPASGFQSIQFRELEFVAGLKDDRYFSFFENEPGLLARLQRRYHAVDLRQAYYSLLHEQGFRIPKGAYHAEDDPEHPLRGVVIQTLRKIYQDPEGHLPLYLLSEKLVEFDETLCLWRFHHVRVVERIIGHKMGTGGSSGVDYLESTTAKKCFPCLWEVRAHLTPRGTFRGSGAPSARSSPKGD